MLASLVLICLTFFKGIGTKALPIVVVVISIWGIIALMGAIYGLDFFSR